MTKSYRLRTEVGTDKNIRININQDFDFLEILSLKLRQGDVYTRFCADYGVVAGRVIVNGGYGIPNATVSVFIPLDQVDENDPVISTLYPYKTPVDKNEDGYRYNLLPYRKSYGGHTPTGTFPDKEDVLTRSEVLEVYEKYYKYTTKTNDSGDFMIIGVPLGIQTIVMDLDLSDMGCFSLRPKDLIRAGLGVAEQFDGENFKSSEDLASLPQIVNFIRNVDVTPFWGENDLCNIGITRTDFDLRELGIEIKPQAVFMGSIFSTSDEEFLRTNCKPNKGVGKLCNLESSGGKILTIRQTIGYDNTGRPVLEQFNLPNGGKVIDDDGTWLVELPMNIDYVTTNEFGEQVISNDPSVGIPTKGRYRFRVQYQNEDIENSVIQRADYLVPNIREYGWTNSGKYEDVDTNLQLKSYAFSLNWDDYVDPIAAINCEDYFYEFNFNKVYTIANFIDRFKWALNRSRHLGIKEIDSKDCNQINKLPVNDGVRNFDFINFLFNLILSIIAYPILNLIIILHVLALLWPIFYLILVLLRVLINAIYPTLCEMSKVSVAGKTLFPRLAKYCTTPPIDPIDKQNPFKRISLPMMTYPDCEACPCTDTSLDDDENKTQDSINTFVETTNNSSLSDVNLNNNYTYELCDKDNNPQLTCGEPERVNNEFNQLFSGFIKTSSNECNNKLKGLPIGDIENQFNLGFDVTLAQSLNLLNVRGAYFDNVNLKTGNDKLGGSIITYQTRNIKPKTTDVFPSDWVYDQPLIILCDSGTLQTLGVGNLLTFYDPKNNNDPNLTGATTNEFNTNSIVFKQFYKDDQLAYEPIVFIKPDGTTQSVYLPLDLSKNEKKPYVHSAGVEYFQIITGGTISQFETIVGSNGGPLYNYILNKKQSTVWGLSNGGNRYPLIGQNSLKNYNEYENLEILILTRGVDPYTDKQKIKYDLSKLFGFNINSGNVTVEGDYYLNVPIQPNTGGNPLWRYDQYTPESHNIDNNTNLSLYHRPFGGFLVDFSAFTSNNPHYYNSTDKSQANFKAYSDNGCTELTTLGNYTVGGLGYQSSTPNSSNYPNTMLFEYSVPQSTTVYTEDFSTTPTGWFTQTSFWDLNYFNPHPGCPNFSMQCDTIGTPSSQTERWAITPGITMVANKTYRISFKYRVETITQKLKITIGNGNTIATQTNILSDNSLYKTSCTQLETDFLCNSDGVYYFGFNCYSNNNSGDLYIYDLEVIETTAYMSQGRIEGGSFMTSNVQQYSDFYTNGYVLGTNTLSINQPRVYSPAYHTTSPSDITITESYKPIFRSDRLPTSDKTQIVGNSSLSLHLNSNFNIYQINENGESAGTAVPNTTIEATDETNNLQDLKSDVPRDTDKVLDTLTCEGMVPLKCYGGSGDFFYVIEDCEDNKTGRKDKNKRVDNGCYYFVDNRLIVTLLKDFEAFFEWRARYRIVFAACRGVFSQVFQNNWLNGSLYMYSFKRQTVYNIKGEPKKYKYCGTTDTRFREGQGTLFYTEGTTNSIFYRSTPYDGNTKRFVGQIPQSRPLGVGPYINVLFGATNDRNLFSPTTIMDLGSRDLYTKEICSNPNFQGYLMNSLKSTSYNDTADVLQLAFLSRMVSSKWWERIIGLGDASVSAFFSRSGARLDGDITQMFSINSEFGVIPFGDEEYDDNSIYIESGNNKDSLFGIFFSSDTASRNTLTPGVQTFSLTPPLLNYYGYSKTQEVPMYKWESKSTEGTIFGYDKNNWNTDVENGKFYSKKYQSLSFQYAPTADYFNTTPTGQKGYIFNSDVNGNPNPTWGGSIDTEESFIVGAPFHFYFGLYKGKTALNKFIKNYIGN